MASAVSAYIPLDSKLGGRSSTKGAVRLGRSHLLRKNFALTVEPTGQIEYHGPFLRPQAGRVQIKNPTANRIAFKVKCTDNHYFKMEPVVGILGKGQSANIYVILTLPGGKLPTRSLNIFIFHINATRGGSARKAWESGTGNEPWYKVRTKIIPSTGKRGAGSSMLSAAEDTVVSEEPSKLEATDYDSMVSSLRTTDQGGKQPKLSARPASTVRALEVIENENELSAALAVGKTVLTREKGFDGKRGRLYVVTPEDEFGDSSVSSSSSSTTDKPKIHEKKNPVEKSTGSLVIQGKQYKKKELGPALPPPPKRITPMVGLPAKTSTAQGRVRPTSPIQSQYMGVIRPQEASPGLRNRENNPVRNRNQSTYIAFPKRGSAGKTSGPPKRALQDANRRDGRSNYTGVSQYLPAAR